MCSGQRNAFSPSNKLSCHLKVLITKYLDQIVPVLRLRNEIFKSSVSSVFRLGAKSIGKNSK